ncbi:hypothetical protein L1049_001149 [Liquidambar formosana]|uniref:DM2 domain-containing protein n=1 Tax=Liquidambar formosana TaxID=63359 RepID=A0AAP0NBX8_LIQFO
MNQSIGLRIAVATRLRRMLPQRLKTTITENPKKLANLIDLVNLPSTLREFLGQSQISRLGCFMQVWSYIKTNNLQVSNVMNIEEANSFQFIRHQELL